MKLLSMRPLAVCFLCVLTALCGSPFVVGHPDSHPCACDPAECLCVGHQHGAQTPPVQKAESCHLPQGGSHVPFASLAWSSDCGTAASGVFVLFDHAVMCPNAVVAPSPLTREYEAASESGSAAQNIVFPETPPPRLSFLIS